MSIRYIDSNELINDVPIDLQNIINNMDCVYVDGIEPHNQHFNLTEHDDEIRADERAKVIEEVNALIQTRLIDNLALDNATKYGNKSAKQQANSYATVMKYEIADCVEDLLDDLEQLKEQKE